MWTAWLRGLDSDEGMIALAEPVPADALGDAEERLGLILPADLRSLLCETAGLGDAEGAEPVWPAERIAAENVLLRSVGSTPALPDGADEDLLFFGDAGDGNLFAYEIDEEGDITESDIFLWKAQIGEATWVASDLQSMLDAWFSGTLAR